MEQNFSIKKIHACSLSIKKALKWCAFAFKNRQLISKVQSATLRWAVRRRVRSLGSEAEGAFLVASP